jgi:hypothetical protein
VVPGVDQGREHAAKFEVQIMKALFALLGLFALAGCEDTPATGHTAPHTSYPDQPVYTGPQEYRPESYPDPQYPYSPAQNQGLPGLQPIPQPPN